MSSLPRTGTGAGRSLTIPAFPERLYIDLAIGTNPFEDTCWANGVDPDRVRPWEDVPEFQHRLLAAKQAVEDDGRAFRARCRTIVHDNVGQMETIIQDRDVTAGHRIDAFKTLAKLGELEPREEQNRGAGGGLSLTIIAPGGEQVRIMSQGAVPPGPEPIEGELAPQAAKPPQTLEPEALDDWAWA